MPTANLNIKSVWLDEDVLISHLASELVRGRLALLLGAGVSSFYGLPEWTELVNRLCDRCNEPRMNPGDDPLEHVAALRIRHYKNKTLAFLKAVADELYKGSLIDLEKIRKNDTLASIGSLVMASRRGNASTVITFNYDDLLETYLEYHGFIARSIFKPRHWAGNSDVTLYHPHGYLPRNRPNDWSSDIVLGTQEYLEIMQPDAQNLWRPLLQTIMRTHSIIYIGLSGKDAHLKSLLSPLNEQHAVNEARLAFHGIRFGLKSSPDKNIETIMDNWGVHTHKIDSYQDIAPFLFKVCQAARRIRTRSEEGL